MRTTAIVIACFGAAALGGPVAGQDRPADERETPAQPPGEPDIVVRGRRVGDLRLEIERAQEAVYLRFNDINSDDRFDIHCYTEVRYHSHIKERVCQSNSWREQSKNVAQATLHELRGESTPPAAEFQGERLYMEDRLRTEMRRLAGEDPQLRQAIIDVAKAQFALSEQLGQPPPFSLAQPVQPGSDGLPYGAERVFQVRIGQRPWEHALTQRTFTLAQVYGDIRRLELACDGENERLRYEEGLEWTVPAGSSDCVLSVHAKPNTSFALYEFE